MTSIKFCELCGKILKIKNSDGKAFCICPCGFVKEYAYEITFSEKQTKKEEVGSGVLTKDESKGFPHICKKCGFDGCDVFDLGAPYSDESNVYLYKCKKCNYVERYAEGTGNT